MNTRNFLIALVVGLCGFQAHASGLTLDCREGGRESQSTVNLSIRFESATQISIGDGGELGAEYVYDASESTQAYIAYKIAPASQDGEQPGEIKIARVLMSRPGINAPVWLAPGIVGGAFVCESVLSR